MSRTLTVASSLAASSLRLWRGTAAFRPGGAQPEQPLQLYEFEACPFCRLVREALTEMDLDAMILPCPQGGSRFRPEVQKRGGKKQFPYLVDPNAGREMYESADIIDYLSRSYGGGGTRRAGPLRGAAVLGGGLASSLRGFRGRRARSSRPPEHPLELYSFESSPYSRLVREVLCELELPYLLRNTGKAQWKDMGPPELRARLFPGAPVQGRNRQRLLELTGKVQLPYLVDPNTGTALYESADIIRYLEQQYAA
jgi:glutathione S-transferase